MASTGNDGGENKSMQATCQDVRELVGRKVVGLAQGTAGDWHSNPRTCLRRMSFA